jgi:hypothetical protein
MDTFRPVRFGDALPDGQPVVAPLLRITGSLPQYQAGAIVKGDGLQYHRADFHNGVRHHGRNDTHRRRRTGDPAPDRGQSPARRLPSHARGERQRGGIVDAQNAAQPGTARLDTAADAGDDVCAEAARRSAHVGHSDHHAERPRAGVRQGRRARSRSGRLRHQALLAARAARAHQGGAAALGAPAHR